MRDPFGGMWLATFLGGPSDGAWTVVDDAPAVVVVPVLRSLCTDPTAERAEPDGRSCFDAVRYYRAVMDEPSRQIVYRVALGQ